jgi:hypothetical protein
LQLAQIGAFCEYAPTGRRARRWIGRFAIFPTMGGQMKARLRWIVATYLFCASTVAFAGNLPGGTGTNFWVGYNEAWFGENYLNSLASNPYFYPAYPSSSFFDPTFVDTIFAGMASGGAKIVRVMVFTAAQGIVLDPSKTKTLGLTDDLIGNSSKGILSNLKSVFIMARNHGLKVYVTALQGNDMTKKSTDITGLRSYFSNLLTNTKLSEGREAFKANALGPLLEMLNQFNLSNPGVVYAFEVINEIEAPLNSRYFSDGWTGARRWIKDVATFVKLKSPWLPVTASAGWGFAVTEITFGLLSNLNLDFYDLHVYVDWGKYSGETGLCNKVSADKVPIILGEYGPKSKTIDDNLQYWTTYNFINGAKNFINGAKGYCFWAALAWKYEASGAQSEPWFGYLVLPKYCSRYPSGGPSCDSYPQLSGPPYPSCPSQTCQYPYVRPAYSVIQYPP